MIVRKYIHDIAGAMSFYEKASKYGFTVLRMERIEQGTYFVEAGYPSTRPVLRDCLDKILGIIGVYTSLTPQEIREKGRKGMRVEARRIAIMFILQNFPNSLQSVGNLFAGRDHSTIIHARNSFLDLYETDKGFRQLAEVCFRDLNKHFGFSN